MAWTERGARKGAKRLPERVRKYVLSRTQACYFSFPGICTWPDGRKEVHHVVEAEDGGSDDPRSGNLVGACKACHVHHSARMAVKRRDSWKRKPEKHPGVLD